MSAETADEAARKIPAEGERVVSPNFITDIIDRDLREGRVSEVVTRFPPEPNGYPHIGHTKSMALNFGLAQDYGGACNLRFDDTNPETESMEYVEAMIRDVAWLGFTPARVLYASDYFDTFYQCALELIRQGKAYVDSVSEEEMRRLRGDVNTPGRPSPYRDRGVDENLELFERMKGGAFGTGEHVLRAKIDLTSSNFKLRDPVLYRIMHAHHYRTGDRWCIYPLYDFAHPLEDFIEGVSHSLCTLEFENNRAIYDWLIESLRGRVGFPKSPRPYQYEFARLALDYTVLSKRKLLQLVKEKKVEGWDDPRMPTLSGIRRRGITPEAVRAFAQGGGVGRTNSRAEIAQLEHAIRDDLNFRAPRVMAVLEPLKLTLTNFAEGETEWLEASYWPHDVPREGTRRVPFSRELWVERGDFMQEPSKGFHRLSPGVEVRLRYAYVVRCDEVVTDPAGRVTELRCSYDPDTLGKNPEGRKVKGTIHWLSAAHALPAELRLYDRLFRVPDPGAGEQPLTEQLNPESLGVRRGFVEPSVADDPAETRYQFERQGYFWRDPVDSAPGAPVFNRIVTLRDSWAKTGEDRGQGPSEPERAAKRPAPAEGKRGVKGRPSGEAPDPALDFTAEERARLERYSTSLGVNRDDAVLLAGDPALSAFFEEALAAHDNPQGIANWLVNELLRELKGATLADLKVSPSQLAALVALADDGTITGRIAKEVFAEMLATGADPKEVVEGRGLEQVSDRGTLEPVVEALLAAHPDKVEAYRAGKTGLFGFFVGQVMRETGGKANPQLVQELLTQRLS